MARPAVMVGFAVLLLGGACSDDDGGDTDQGGAADTLRFPDGGSSKEGGLLPDTAAVVADQGAGKDVAVATQNSGAICSTGQPCPNAGEECIVFDSVLGKGMCLDPCAKQGDPCPVPDSNTQLSVCATSGYSPGTWYCAWLCEIGGKTYSCPNGTDYTCVPSSDGVAQFCRPK